MTNREPDRETAAIHRLTRHLSRAAPQVVVGIGDDAAVVRTGERTIVTTDAFVEGTHFEAGWLSAADIGYKAAVSAASDVFAMGGEPTWMTTAVIAPSDTSLDTFDELGRGLADAAGELGVSIVGGDVARGPALTVVVHVMGNLSGDPFRLDGARPGDDLVVTRPLGAMAAALHLLLNGTESTPGGEEVIARFRRPRVERNAGHELRRMRASAVTDVSDGLLREARRIAAVAGVDVLLRREDIPVDPAAREVLEAVGLDPVAAALQSGEEYALLAAIPGWSTLVERPRQQGEWRGVGLVVAPRAEPAVRWRDTGEVVDLPEAFPHFG